MNSSLVTHIKHLILWGALIGAAYIGFRAYVAADLKKAELVAETAKTVATNQATVAKAQQAINAATASNTTLDATRDKQIAQLQAQLAAKPDSAQVKAIVEQVLPGVKTVPAVDAQGQPVIAVADTQANRDAINKAQVDFKTCQFSLTDCQAKEHNYINIIAAKDQQLGADKSTIDAQGKEIMKLKSWGKGGNIWARTGRVIIPIACAGAGAYLGANKGTKGAAIGALAGGGACGLAFHF